MSTPLSALRNIGPALETRLVAAGVKDAESLRELGTDAAYALMLANGERAHFIVFYVIEMALQGRPWNDAKGDEKAALKERFDALKRAHANSDAKGRLEFEAALNEIGVIGRSQPTSSRPAKK